MFETLALDRPALPEWLSQGDRIDRNAVLERQIARLQAEQATEIVTYASATRGVAGERGVAAEVALARWPSHG